LVAVFAQSASALVNPGPVRSMTDFAPPGPPRIVLYGDSLVSEGAQDFSFLAGQWGASVRVRTFPGTAICDYLSAMTADADGWLPTVAVLAFSGDAFTPCMASVQLGSPQYYAKYKDDAQTAISIFRSVGTKVVLVGLPRVASPSLSENVAILNAVYQFLADTNPGVMYDDAGEAVMANGQFTWTLPCLPGEPCTGPSGTNVVRSPDGVHFCPSGGTTLVGGLEECDVYSSGAFRFADAMLAPVLPSPPPSLFVTSSPPSIAASSQRPTAAGSRTPIAAGSRPPVCTTQLSHTKRSVVGKRTHTLSSSCEHTRRR
jgi:hypothetical protein